MATWYFSRAVCCVTSVTCIFRRPYVDRCCLPVPLLLLYLARQAASGCQPFRQPSGQQHLLRWGGCQPRYTLTDRDERTLMNA